MDLKGKITKIILNSQKVLVGAKIDNKKISFPVENFLQNYSIYQDKYCLPSLPFDYADCLLDAIARKKMLDFLTKSKKEKKEVSFFVKYYDFTENYYLAKN